MTDQPQPLDLDAIEARANNATRGPWEPRPHQHAASGCRCLGCHEDPTGWTIDHANTTFCDDAVAKLSAAGKTNDFGRELDSCDEGPFLTYADAEFAAHAREDVPALLAEIRRLRAENERMTALNQSKAESIRALNAECKALRSERKEARRQASRSKASVLARASARLRSYCPDHGDDSLPTAFLDCHCPAADDLDRSATRPAAVSGA